MSATASHPTPRTRQICALLCIDTYTIISIQDINIEVRVSANNMTWMKKAHQIWLTLPELKTRLDDQLEPILALYNHHMTYDNWLFQDSELNS